MIEVRELVKKVKEAKNKKLWKSISVQAMTRALGQLKWLMILVPFRVLIQ